MTQEKHLQYQGRFGGVAGDGKSLLFTTVHPEGFPAALHRLDVETFKLQADPLSTGGQALLLREDAVWIGGVDGKLYKQSRSGGAVTATGAALGGPVVALAPLSEGRLAAAAGETLSIVAADGKKILQSFPLAAEATALVADPTGQWLVVGSQDGTAAVFECEEKAEFLKGESAKLHQGAVTALLFEPEELRFFSAGVDRKLLLTHARGKLESEDKGGANSHEEPITAILHGPENRLFTAGRDKSVKNWARQGGGRPSTLKDGLVSVGFLALVEVHQRPHLAVLCDDQSIRLVGLDAAGKLGQVSTRIYGLSDWYHHELGAPEPKVREAAIAAVASRLDRALLERTARAAEEDSDAHVRRAAARLVAGSNHPAAAGFLTPLQRSQDEAVRGIAFQGLRRIRGENDLGTLSFVLDGEFADLGLAAVEGLKSLAAKNDLARELLEKGLGAKAAPVRYAALSALEAVVEGLQPLLVASRAKSGDVRSLAIVRALQRKFLEEPAAASMLRRGLEDADATVRKSAFLASVLSRPALASALRSRDADLHKQLSELERMRPDGTAAPAGEAAKAPRPAKGAAPLSPEDKSPLFQAMAARAIDVCLMGALGMASLGERTVLTLLLQLSREEDSRARGAVARALAILDDPRAEQRLLSMLHDPAADVRDAAFSALAELYAERPLEAADAALFAPAADVRRRGLQLLLSHIKKKSPPFPADPAWETLRRALDDGESAVRSEAFKAALNLEVAGGGLKTLGFLRKSVQEEVRRSVFTEATGRFKEAGVAEFVYEYFDDPSPTLRKEALAFALEQAKKQDLPVLERALRSKHPDLRTAALTRLAAKTTAAGAKLIEGALADEDKGVRQTALKTLLSFDALDRLRSGLSNPHDDVRIRSAAACARHGDRGALEVLLAQVRIPQPDRKELVAPWQELQTVALEGLGELGAEEAVPELGRIVDSTQSLPPLRQAAAAALALVDAPAAVAALRGHWADSDKAVAQSAALAAALAGDLGGVSALLGQGRPDQIPPPVLLGVVFSLRERMFETLVNLLDSPSETLRLQVVRLFAVWEWQSAGGPPRRALALLSARDPRTRLLGAEVVEASHDVAALGGLVLRLFNERESGPAWKITAETLAAFAECLCFGPPHLQVRLVRLLSLLDSKDQDAWDHGWNSFRARWPEAIAQAAAAAKGAKRPEEGGLSAEERRNLALGAYLGLLREQGASGGAKALASPSSVIRVRQSAIRELARLAAGDGALAAEVAPPLLQALSDPHQAVRRSAFDVLLSLGAPKAVVAAEALAVGHVDLGEAALKELSDGNSAEAARGLLIQTIRERDDALAVKAAEMLAADVGRTAAAEAMLESSAFHVRSLGANWLADEYATSAQAQAALRGALASRDLEIRRLAAVKLARRQDAAAAPFLVQWIGQCEGGGDWYKLREAVQAFPRLDLAEALVQRARRGDWKVDVACSALEVVGNYRIAEVAPLLLEAYETPNPDKAFARIRDEFANAALTIAGYDQTIQDRRDERPDRSWEAKQYPRRDDLFAWVLAAALRLQDWDLWQEYADAVQWSRGPDVDAVLPPAIAGCTDEDLRRELVEAAGWRLKHRKGPAETLLPLLQDKDPEVRFFAAEGLAKAGRSEGLDVLLAAVDLLDDLSLRRRAVLALGESGDARGLDVLLRLAEHDGHALQEPAAEAIGRMGKSKEAARIGRLLARLAHGTAGVASRALVGLRWLDTEAGWEVVRRVVKESREDDVVEAGLAQLGWCARPDTVPFLADYVAACRPDQDERREWALDALRRAAGPDSLEVVYAALRNPRTTPAEVADALPRFLQEADPRRLLELAPTVPAAFLGGIETALSVRSDVPTAVAWEAVAHPSPKVAAIGGKLAGRAGSAAPSAAPAVESSAPKEKDKEKPPAKAAAAMRKKAAKGAATPPPEAAAEAPSTSTTAPAAAAGGAGIVETALEGWSEDWVKVEERLRRGQGNRADLERRPAVQAAVRALAWAASRLGVGAKRIVEIASDPRLPAEARGEVLAAYRPASLSEETAAALGKLVREPGVGRSAARLLAERNATAGAAWLPTLWEDAAKFQEAWSSPGAASFESEPLQAAAGNVHSQPLALPALVARRDADGLGRIARDGAAAEGARLGAVEGLARLGDEKAEAVLIELGKKKDEDEDFRKACWRGVRRSWRVRKKAAVAKA